MLKKNYLLILTGLPSSGKSTFANLFKIEVESQENVKVKIIDPDKIRQGLYSEDFDYQKENEVRKINLRKIKLALKNNYIVISDDLNYYTSMRHDLKMIAEQLKKKFFIIHISTPLDVCLRWNEIRGILIPNEVIINIYNKFDMFDKYSWDTPFITLDLSKIKNLKVNISDLVYKINLTLKPKQKDFKSKKKSKHIDLDYNNELDKITRRIVSEILKNRSSYPQKNTILKLRKEFIDINIERNLNISEISIEFFKFLKEHLNLEI